MTIYTIGFTKKSAREFFDTLRRNSIKQIADIRLNNVSQLAGFTKRGDLEYFLRELCGIDYYHLDFLAPTKEMRDRYSRTENWDIYVREYVKLLNYRNAVSTLSQAT